MTVSILPTWRDAATVDVPAVDPAAPATAPETMSARRGGPLRAATPYLLLAAAQLLVALDLDVPVVRPVVALATFVLLPALVLHRRATLPADSSAARMAYALGLSVLGLIVGGLAVDTLLPLAGVAHPLAPVPLAAAWFVIDAGLLSWRRSVPLVMPGATRAAVRRALDARLELAPTLGVVGLLLSVAGAVRLNNGASGAVALAAQAVAAAALLALLLGRARSLGRDAWVVGLVAAGLLLATSLRGWNITGHDIQAEFLAFRLTDGAQNWELDALPNAYNACLSVTILPTVLVQATGLSGEVVFKVLLQLVFACVPVLTYLFARRVVGRRLALAGAVMTIAFPTFSTDMPYLVRQEIAFFFLALMLLAATEPRRTRVGTKALVVVLGAGMVLSHYSTTYLLLMALVIGLACLGLARIATRGRQERSDTRAGRDRLVLLHPLVVGALVVLALSWAGPVTGTGGHAREVVAETVDALQGKGDGGPGSSDTSYWVFAGDETTPRERMDLFVAETIAYRDDKIPADLRVLPNPRDEVLTPELHEQATAPPTAIGSKLDAIGLDPETAVKAMRFGAALLMQVFAVLGLLWLARRRGRVPGQGRRPTREVTFLTWGAMGALGLVVTVPNLSVDYGVLRAFQQTLLIIAPAMAMGLWVALKPVRSRSARAGAVLVGLVPVLLLGVLAGVLPSVLGGQQQRMSLANAGTYYDRFFASDAEMTAIDWLGATDRADKENERLIASRNVNVRLLALSDNRAPVADRLFPTLLSDDAYVFVDDQILDEGVSTVFYTGDLLTYTYPLGLVDRRMDLLYSSPDARVYK